MSSHGREEERGRERTLVSSLSYGYTNPALPSWLCNHNYLQRSHLQIPSLYQVLGLPRWLSGEKSTCQCKDTQGMWVQFLGQEAPLEEEVATHSSILPWKIPWTERSLAGYRLGGCKELDTTEWACTQTLRVRASIYEFWRREYRYSVSNSLLVRIYYNPEILFTLVLIFWAT